jgi:ribosomal protein L18E
MFRSTIQTVTGGTKVEHENCQLTQLVSQLRLDLGTSQIQVWKVILHGCHSSRVNY